MRESSGESARRQVVYCVIPAELAPKLHELLREHFGEDRGVEVVVERRAGERRSGEDRRSTEGERPAGKERRDVHGLEGRRIGERRAPAVAAEPPDLPRRARRYATRLRFSSRLEPAGDEAEDRDTARLVARIQAGERELFATLYTRYFSRLYGYLRLAINDRHEAEDLTQDVFVKALKALPRYEHRAQPFRAWLFTIARNTAIKHLRKHGRIDVVEPAEAARRQDEAGADAADAAYDEGGLNALGWITDPDLQIFVERLPPDQRQVLVMRFMLDLSAAQIAANLGKQPEHVRKLQERGLRFLQERLTAIGRAPASSAKNNPPMRRWDKQAPVIRNRRFMLE